MTGPELKKLSEHLGEAVGRKLTLADMAKLCGLPEEGGANTIRKWEVSGPSGPVAELLRILSMASDHYPTLDMFNVFDRPPAGKPSASRCAATCCGGLVKQNLREPPKSPRWKASGRRNVARPPCCLRCPIRHAVQ